MIPFVSIVGKGGVGKTTLLEKLISEFKSRGYRLAVVKHHAHAKSLDVPGKDSWRFALAGADAVIVSSPVEVVRFERVNHERTLVEIAQSIHGVDLILTEGFMREAAPQIEVVRAACGTELIASPDNLIAVASDCPIMAAVPRFDLEDVDRIATFLIRHLGLSTKGGD